MIIRNPYDRDDLNIGKKDRVLEVGSGHNPTYRADVIVAVSYTHLANEIISRAYDIIESQSDIVVHMGRFSRDEFLTRYPDSQNTVIPHHIYQYTYKEDISVERARQYLNLSQDAFIVTAFGKFRNREEIRMVLGAFRSWNEERKMLLAPRLYPFSRHNNYGRNFLKRWISRAGYYLFMPLFNRIYKLQAGANDELIDNCDLPYYMAASDVIFILSLIHILGWHYRRLVVPRILPKCKKIITVSQFERKRILEALHLSLIHI